MSKMYEQPQPYDVNEIDLIIGDWVRCIHNDDVGEVLRVNGRYVWVMSEADGVIFTVMDTDLKRIED